jgi:hypothetical protein
MDQKEKQLTEKRKTKSCLRRRTFSPEERTSKWKI